MLDVFSPYHYESSDFVCAYSYVVSNDCFWLGRYFFLFFICLRLFHLLLLLMLIIMVCSFALSLFFFSPAYYSSCIASRSACFYSCLVFFVSSLLLFHDCLFLSYCLYSYYSWSSYPSRWCYIYIYIYIYMMWFYFELSRQGATKTPPPPHGGVCCLFGRASPRVLLRCSKEIAADHVCLCVGTSVAWCCCVAV